MTVDRNDAERKEESGGGEGDSTHLLRRLSACSPGCGKLNV